MKGRIYKIYSCLDNADENDVYYGSTKKQIQARFLCHKNDYKSYKEQKYHYVSSFQIFEKYTPECCDIELVEEFDFISDTHLWERESFYILNNKCVNQITPGHNCIRILCECGDTYTYKHKTRHMATAKHLRALTGEKKPTYKETHQEEILAWKKEKKVCGCGGKYTNSGKSCHDRSERHKKWLIEQSK